MADGFLCTGGLGLNTYCEMLEKNGKSIMDGSVVLETPAGQLKSDAQGGDGDAAAIEDLHGLDKPFTLATEQVGRRNPAIFQHQR